MSEPDQADLTELERTNKIKAEMGLVLSPMAATTLILMAHKPNRWEVGYPILELIDLGLAERSPNRGRTAMTQACLTEEGRRHIQKILQLPIGDAP